MKDIKQSCQGRPWSRKKSRIISEKEKITAYHGRSCDSVPFLPDVGPVYSVSIIAGHQHRLYDATSEKG